MRSDGSITFFPADLGPELTALSHEEIGVYMLFMMHAWNFGGPLPMDEFEALADKQWSSLSSKLKRRFEVADDLITLPWLEKKRQEQRAFREKQSANGKKKGQKASNPESDQIAPSEEPERSQTEAKQEPKPNPRVGLGLGLGLDTGSSEKERANLEARLDALWLAFGSRGSKPTALRYWLKLPEVDRLAIEAKLPAYLADQPDPKFRKHLQGWINPENRLWESATANEFRGTVVAGAKWNPRA